VSLGSCASRDPVAQFVNRDHRDPRSTVGRDDPVSWLTSPLAAVRFAGRSLRDLTASAVGPPSQARTHQRACCGLASDRRACQDTAMCAMPGSQTSSR
jgi:hypothetical protein